MRFSELPQQVQNALAKEQRLLHLKKINTSYEVLVYNEAGTRFFSAKRVQSSWQDTNGNYMPYGGGSKWIIKYGEMGFRTCRNPFGEIDAELRMGKTFGKSKNGTVIPNCVATKKEVLALIAQIGIF